MTPVTFIEDRNGRALVRLPNGSKTSLRYNALSSADAYGHFIPEVDDSAVRIYCLECDWWHRARLWPDAHDALVAHAAVHRT